MSTYRYAGLITCHIHQTNDPRLSSVGDLCGLYFYQSPTVDGRFFAQPQMGSDNVSLQGYVPCYFPGAPDFPKSLPSCQNGASLTVSGGKVTGFVADDQSGQLSMHFDLGGFDFRSNDANSPAEPAQYLTSGTVQLQDPVKIGPGDPVPSPPSGPIINISLA